MEAKGTNQIIEEMAASLLDEDKLKTFLDFYNFININNLRKVKTGRKVNGSWAIQYKKKMIGSFVIGSSWSISCFNLFSRNQWFEKCEKYISAELKDFVLTNINTTSRCCVDGTCHSVENEIILGKMFNNRVCACRPIKIIDPGGKTLEYAKELVLIGKNIIAEMASSSIE